MSAPSPASRPTSRTMSAGCRWTSARPAFVVRGRFDEQNFDVQRAEIEASKTSGWLTASAAYRLYRRDVPTAGIVNSPSAVSATASLQIFEQWRVFGNIAYDFTDKTVARDSVGIAYDDSCVSLSIAYSETRGTADPRALAFLWSSVHWPREASTPTCRQSQIRLERAPIKLERISMTGSHFCGRSPRSVAPTLFCPNSRLEARGEVAGVQIARDRWKDRAVTSSLVLRSFFAAILAIGLFTAAAARAARRARSASRSMISRSPATTFPSAPSFAPDRRGRPEGRHRGADR